MVDKVASTVITPTSASPRADGMQTNELDTSRVYILDLVGGEAAKKHTLKDKTTLIEVFVAISSDDPFPVVEAKRGTGPATWPFFSGKDFKGVATLPRDVFFSFAGTGTAQVRILEA